MVYIGMCPEIDRDRLWFLRFLVLKWVIIFASFGNAFLAYSLDMVPNLHQLKLKRASGKVGEKEMAF